MNNELVEKLLSYYKENAEDFVDDIEELDSWTDYLYDDKIYLMEDLDEVLQDIEPSDVHFIQEIIDNRIHLSLSEGAENIIDNYEDENE